MRLHTTLVLLFLAVAVRPAAGDEVRLQNGDRLTGRVVSLADGTLAFVMAQGRLNISWGDVVALTVDDPIVATVGTAEPTEVTIGPADPGEALLQPGTAVVLTDIVALVRPATPVFSLGANIGFVTTGGNSDVRTLRVDSDAALRRGPHRYTASASLTHSEDRGALQAQHWTTSLNYDRFVSERVFLNANGILTSDRFRDLDLRIATGFGIGYQVFASRRIRLTANAGLGYVNENLVSAADRYAAAREAAALELFVVPERIQLFHRHDGYFGLGAHDSLFIKTQNGVRLPLWAGFVTTVQADLDYDLAPAPGRHRTDRTFALTFGYRF